MTTRQQKRTLEILIEARKLLSNPKHWVKSHSAVDKDGNTLGSCQSRKAVAFCSSGALARAAGKGGDNNLAFTALGLGLPEGRTCPIAFNDGMRTTHKQILRMFDRAIAKFRLQIKTV